MAARRRVDKTLTLKTAARFLFVPRGGPWPLEAVRGDLAQRDGSEAANRDNVQYHYDLSNEFYALFLDRLERVLRPHARPLRHQVEDRSIAKVQARRNDEIEQRVELRAPD